MAEVWLNSPEVRPIAQRYARLIAGLITTTGPGAIGDTFTQAGVAFAKVVVGGTPQTAPVFVAGTAVDRLGHARPLYQPLLAYALLRGGGEPPAAARDFQSTWEGPATAAVGDRVAAAVWAALANLAGGAPADAGPLRVIQRLTDGQQPSGAFLAAGRSDNLEALWFHELASLHAVASFAIQANQPALWPAVARAVRFHAEETQPDHATNQPWGLTAFLLEPDGWPLADSMLHAASAHAAVEGSASRGVTLMLLADALYCLHQLGIPHD